MLLDHANAKQNCQSKKKSTPNVTQSKTIDFRLSLPSLLHQLLLCEDGHQSPGFNFSNFSSFMSAVKT